MTGGGRRSGGGPPLRWPVFALLVLAWEAATRLADDRFFPPPSAVAAHARELWFSGPASRLFLTDAAIGDILPSLGRMAAGLGLAIVVGVPLGFAVGRSPVAHACLDPVLQLLRAIPPPTLVPLFIVLLRVGAEMQIVTIVFATVWPIALNTAAGAGSVAAAQLETAAVFQLTPVRRLLLVLLPSAMPKIFAGLRTGLGVALILMVFAELMPGASNGIGYLLQDAYAVGDLLGMWSAVLLIGVLGYLLNAALLAVQRRVLAWQDGSAG